jgi:hypothetical protein
MHHGHKKQKTRRTVALNGFGGTSVGRNPGKPHWREGPIRRAAAALHVLALMSHSLEPKREHRIIYRRPQRILPSTEWVALLVCHACVEELTLYRHLLDVQILLCRL